MIVDLGVKRPGSRFRIPFGSFAASTGAPSAVTNYADADILVYKDGSVTQRASSSGLVATTTFDSLTGINLIDVDTADNTTAGFWAAGSEYFIIIGDITVDGQTLRFPSFRFELGLTEAILNTTIATLASQTSFTLTVGSANDDAYNGCVLYVHDVASAVQCCLGVILDYTGASKTVTLAADPGIFTMATTDNVSILPPSNTKWLGTTVQTAKDVGAAVPAAAAGASGGLLISGSNAGTTTLAALTVTGSLTVSDGLLVSRSTANQSAIVATGNGTGHGAILTSGSGATGDGLRAVSAATNGIGIQGTGNGSGDGMQLTAGGTGVALDAATATMAITGNITGNLSGSVGSVTGNVGGNVTGSVGSIASGGITNASIAADTGFKSFRSNTAQAGGASTITLDASASATNDLYNNNLVVLTGGTGAGQSNYITDYDGTTKVATVNTAWTVQPDNTTTFAIAPGALLPGASAPTAAQVATAVWQDTTAGDFTVAGSIGRGLFTSGALPGAASGVMIAGSNAATTFATLTVTGNATLSDGLIINRSTANVSAIVATGNGTGHGALLTSGSGATGNGLTLVAASTNGHGLKSTGVGTGDGVELTAGASGVALDAATATMAITGNITGNLSGSVGSVTGAVGSVTGNVGGNVTGTVGSVVGAVGSVTGNVGGNVAGSVGSIGANGIATASFVAGAITAAVTDSTFDESIADALLGRTNGIETGITPKQAWRAMGSALGGVLSGAATTTVNINELGGTGATRISATVDANGNRSAVVLTL